MLTVFGSLAESEHKNILERQKVSTFSHPKKGQDFRPALLEVLNINQSISLTDLRMLFRDELRL